MLQVNRLNVIGDNVLLEGIKPDKRDGIVRGITTDDKPEIGRVLKVGPGKRNDYTGQLVEMNIRPGMLVLFNQHTTTKFNIDGKDYYSLKEEDVIAFQ